MIPHAPIEDDPRYAYQIDEAMKQARHELKDHRMNGQPGFCHLLWGRKKEILRETYGIDWRTPKEISDIDDPLRMHMFD